jgi:hypothetical protein
MPVQPEYRTLFEIGFRTFPWLNAFQPLVFVAIGFALFRFSTSQYKKAIGSVMGVFAIVFTILATTAILPKALEQRTHYLSGESATVEGVVQNFRGAPQLGPARESFTVGGVLFSYNALDATACFHNAPIHRGPIRDDLTVRITYSSACIQKVEVLR